MGKTSPSEKALCLWYKESQGVIMPSTLPKLLDTLKMRNKKRGIYEWASNILNH